MITKDNELILIEYARRGKERRPYGAIVAVIDPVKHPGIAVLGWSLCRKGDQWNRELARTIALGRARAETDSSIIPASLQEVAGRVANRAQNALSQLG